MREKSSLLETLTISILRKSYEKQTIYQSCKQPIRIS